jgi:hypothetical protein
MSNHEIMLGFQWLQYVLTQDATLMGYVAGNVFRSLAPATTQPPYIIYGYQSGSDVLTVNAVRLTSNLLYQVKVCGPASMDITLAAAATEIDKVLKRPAGIPITPDGLGAILAGYRESPLIVDSEVNGEVWSNVGGLYRLEIQQTS